MTMVLAMCWSVPLGVISAVRQDTWSDYVARLLSVSGLSIPAFFVGVLMLFCPVRFFQWTPPLEFTAFFDDPTENLIQLIWPALAEAYYISAPLTRLTRSLMLEVIGEDYVPTARAKGLSERLVVYHHALRNVLIPLVTFVSWSGGWPLGGVVVMELIFAVPGMGTGLIEGVNHRGAHPALHHPQSERAGLCRISPGDGGVPLADYLRPYPPQLPLHLHRAVHRQCGPCHRRRGGAELPGARRPRRRALLGRDAQHRSPGWPSA